VGSAREPTVGATNLMSFGLTTRLAGLIIQARSIAADARRVPSVTERSNAACSSLYLAFVTHMPLRQRLMVTSR
jgi:hypothetical protein